MIRKVISEQTFKDWSKDGQVFFTGGKGYAISPTGETICVGKEDDINRLFDTGEMNQDLSPIQKKVLSNILDYRKELIDGKFEPKKPSAFRSRLTRIAEHRTANIKHPKARKGATVH